MRAALVTIVGLIAAGVGIFAWQRSQIAELRGEVAALREGQDRIESLLLGRTGERTSATPRAALVRLNRDRPADGNEALFRDDERQFILSQYQDAIAQMNLPPATASRLQNLLGERVEAVLDAEDAAMREGFARGSAAMSQAVVAAIGEVDRDISTLLASSGLRPPAYEPAPAPAYEPPAATVVVVAPVSAPAYAEPAAYSSPPYDTSAYTYPYYYSSFPFVTTVVGRPGGRSGIHLGPTGARPGPAGRRARRGF